MAVALSGVAEHRHGVLGRDFGQDGYGGEWFSNHWLTGGADILVCPGQAGMPAPLFLQHVMYDLANNWRRGRSSAYHPSTVWPFLFPSIRMSISVNAAAPHL
jgi:hypothetical protein